MTTQPQPAQPLDLATIQARHQAATGGTWYLQPKYGPDFVATELAGYEHGIGTLDFGVDDQADADREFVLNAHADMGELIARVRQLEQQLAAARERVQALAFDLATGARVVEPAEFDAAFIADGACPHCNHRADWHTARVGEDGGVCANCMCMSPDHRWRTTDLPGVERCAVEPCRARRAASGPAAPR